jgi:hypothetical protein
MFDLALPTLAMMVVAAAFLALERIAPGRELPHAPGWYGRAILINLVQVAITFATNHLWLDLLSGVSLFHLARLESAVLQGFIGWFVGTFVFYWWHRIRHLPGFWVVFHQVHHSPARIEAMTAFYKHPVEILTDSALAAVIMYPLLGSSLGGALWFNFFAALRAVLSREHQDATLGEVFHPDSGVALDPSSARCPSLQLRRPAAMGSPVRNLCDADTFAARCGFPRNNERQLGRMLLFRDVYKD